MAPQGHFSEQKLDEMSKAWMRRSDVCVVSFFREGSARIHSSGRRRWWKGHEKSSHPPKWVLNADLSRKNPSEAWDLRFVCPVSVIVSWHIFRCSVLISSNGLRATSPKKDGPEKELGRFWV